ncbi:MAG TPA: hypothetical protein VHU40_15795 [Polyangia bacterium]|jgi:hypothetical protein|nr:hypothetical protein [Polyangia bacterium]
MDLKQRITTFVILHSGWIIWLLVGLSTGGLMSVLQRLVAMLSNSPAVRRFAHKYLIPSHHPVLRLPALPDAEGDQPSPRFT